MQQSIKFADVSTSTHPVSKKVTYYVAKKEFKAGRIVTVGNSRPFNSEEAAKNEAKRYLLGIEVEASVKPTAAKFYYISENAGSYSITTSLFEHKVGAKIQHEGEWKTILYACTDKKQAIEIWNDIVKNINAKNRVSRAANRCEFSTFLDQLFARYQQMLCA